MSVLPPARNRNNRPNENAIKFMQCCWSKGVGVKGNFFRLAISHSLFARYCLEIAYKLCVLVLCVSQRTSQSLKATPYRCSFDICGYLSCFFFIVEHIKRINKLKATTKCFKYNPKRLQSILCFFNPKNILLD